MWAGEQQQQQQQQQQQHYFYSAALLYSAPKTAVAINKLLVSAALVDLLASRAERGHEWFTALLLL
jgi:hypothetical protein